MDAIHRGHAEGLGPSVRSIIATVALVRTGHDWREDKSTVATEAERGGAVTILDQFLFVQIQNMTSSKKNKNGKENVCLYMYIPERTKKRHAHTALALLSLLLPF